MTNEICYPIHEGKVRKSYQLYARVVETTDSLSVFDRVVTDSVTSKGAVHNYISKNFKHLTADLVPNDLINVKDSFFEDLGFGEEYTGRMSLVRDMTMIPIKFIVRGYLTGRAWSSYRETGKVCGTFLPGGMSQSEKLVMPIITPETKPSTGYSKPITRSEAVDVVAFWLLEICDYSQSTDPDEAARHDAEAFVSKCYEYSLALYDFISKYGEERGILFINTKFEFGLDDEGNIRVGDELGTPDSSRLSATSSYSVGKKCVSLDKQRIIDFCAEAGFHGDEDEVPEIPDSIITDLQSTYISISDQLFGENGFVMHMINCSDERQITNS
jgi:phosphoribosylaminoimidazole-succinocarboxamide synthase